MRLALLRRGGAALSASRPMLLQAPRPMLATARFSSSSDDSKKPGIVDRMTDALMGDRVKKGAEKSAAARESGKSWGEAVAEGQKTQKEDQKHEQHKKLVLELLQIPKYHMSHLREFYVDLLENFDKEANSTMTRARLLYDKATGGSQEEQLAEMRKIVSRQISVMDAMTVHERYLPRQLVGRIARARIVRELGLESNQPIYEVIDRYETFRAQHGWLRREHMAGRRLPSTPDDMQVAMQLKPTRDSYQLMQRARNRLKPEPRPRKGGGDQRLRAFIRAALRERKEQRDRKRRESTLVHRRFDSKGRPAQRRPKKSNPARMSKNRIRRY